MPYISKEEDFETTKGEKIKVPMMRISSIDPPEFYYTETDNLQVLRLPYDGDELSMLILLPKGNLEDVEKTLTYQRIRDLKRQLELRPVEVYMPRFKFEKEYTLNEQLISMGMPTAFSDSADFSGMGDTKRLKIGHVIHKAFIEVNEEGTEAAATTAIAMVIQISVQIRKEPVIFRADHPFFFLIEHNKTGAILFLGRIDNPKR